MHDFLLFNRPEDRIPLHNQMKDPDHSRPAEGVKQAGCCLKQPKHNTPADGNEEKGKDGWRERLGGGEVTADWNANAKLYLLSLTTTRCCNCRFFRVCLPSAPDCLHNYYQSLSPRSAGVRSWCE